ncbi:MAG: ThuA domain-containing protein [Planctomycetes bacterium]|nr:ThuA domain-containing protein [Planctomycetota bacterium]
MCTAIVLQKRLVTVFVLAMTILAAMHVSAVDAAADDAPSIVLTTRSRVATPDGKYSTVNKTLTWNPRETAVVVCDMWDSHHCLNAVRRVTEMAPRMNQVLNIARDRGALIIHAPSSCTGPYKDHPARKRAQGAPMASNVPKDIGSWCSKIPSEEKGTYPIDQSDGGCDTPAAEQKAWQAKLKAAGLNPGAPWKRQIDVIEIKDEDAISDNGVEIWNLMEQRGIKNVILLGVHTNMCVLGRPFGLRQMAKNGKHVVLMRDMTDTMYNPKMAPFVDHYRGTDLIVEHIEKFICPTVLSSDLTGRPPFRFSIDKRPHVVFLVGEKEYQTAGSLTAFAHDELESRGIACSFVHADAKDINHFAGAQTIKTADVLFISVRRRTLPKEQLALVRAHAEAGKPIIGIRTASHAFSLRGEKKPPAGHAAWSEFDRDVLGGNYHGHHGGSGPVAMKPADSSKDHPILRGVNVAAIKGGGSLYQTSPLAKTTTTLVIGSIPNKPAEPIAWTHTYKGGRVFYTSMGHVDDFAQAEFRKLLVNAVFWTLDRKMAQKGHVSAR